MGHLMNYLPFMNQQTGLSGLSDDQLRELAARTGVNYASLKTQQRAEMASAGSQGGGKEEQLIPTVEVRLHTNIKNPRKARRKNIRLLRKMLRPPAYNLGFFKIYRYNASFECACCGVDIRRFLEGENAYEHIIDGDTGLSLHDVYWFDDELGQHRKPHARSRGDHGDEMNSSLCPAHLHIYHTLRKLVEEEEMNSEGLTRPVSQGTKFLRIPLLTGSSSPHNRSTVESLVKYEPFFNMIRQDVKHHKGITLTQHPNPITGVADLVTVTFDLRALQIESALAQQNSIGIPAMAPAPPDGIPIAPIIPQPVSAMDLHPEGQQQ
jgi:hypothetical protein